MKHILLVVILSAASSFALGQMSRSSANRISNDDQAIRQFFNELAAALARNDVAALDRLHSDDFTLVNLSGAVISKAQRLAPIKSGDLKYESFSYDEVNNIRRYGNMAVATARGTWKAQVSGQTHDQQARVTFTLVKTQGHWRVIAAQATAIAGK